MKKWLIIVMLLCVVGCNSEQVAEVSELIPDPNTIAAVGDAAKTIGAVTGRTELVFAGIILGGLAMMVRNLLKGKK